MNQTRNLLLFAWLAVATLLWMQWSAERAPKAPATATATAAQDTQAAVGVPSPNGTIPTAPGAALAQPVQPAVAQAMPAVEVRTDVLRLQLAGDGVQVADLLQYPRSEAANRSPPTGS